MGEWNAYCACVFNKNNNSDVKNDWKEVAQRETLTEVHFPGTSQTYFHNIGEQEEKTANPWSPAFRKQRAM